MGAGFSLVTSCRSGCTPPLSPRLACHLDESPSKEEGNHKRKTITFVALGDSPRPGQSKAGALLAVHRGQAGPWGSRKRLHRDTGMGRGGKSIMEPSLGRPDLPLLTSASSNALSSGRNRKGRGDDQNGSG